MLDSNMPQPKVRILYVDKKTSSAYVRNGEIILRISSFLPTVAAQHAVQQLLAKISPKMELLTSSNFLLQEVLRTSVAEFVGNMRVNIFISWGARPYTKVSPTEIVFKLPQIPKDVHREQLGTHGEFISMEMLTKALLLFAQRYLLSYVTDIVSQWSEYFSFQNLSSVCIKHTESRWGSCSSKGVICISLKTLLLHDTLFEYVCVHEVAHLKEMNHSEKFWNIVAHAMPEWKQLRAEMNTYK